MSLLDTASLIVTPNGYKEGTLYSVVPSSGAGDLSVTRATTATRVNSDGLVELVPYNLLSYSEQFNNGAWNVYNQVTITANSSTAPNGTTTADRLQATGSSWYFSQQKSLTLGVVHTISMYVKSNTGSNQTFKLFACGSLSSADFTATNNWQRFEFTFTSTTDTPHGIARDSSDNTADLLVWGAQLVEGSTAKDYQKTETRLNIPRLDYSNGSCPSILVEPQRTNSITYSEKFDDASWLPTGATITGGILSPSGINNAWTLSNTASAGIIQKAVSLSGERTLTLYAKQGSHRYLYMGGYGGVDSYANFDLLNGVVSNGTNATIENVGNGWYRCTCYSISGTTGGVQIFPSNRASGNATTNGSIYIWGAQLEAGSYATSYIPTTSASVTRNADVISKTGISSLIGQTEGTILFDGIVNNIQNPASNILNTDKNPTAISSFTLQKVESTNKFSFSIFLGNGTLSRISLESTNVFANGTRTKIAIRYKSGDFAMYINGNLEATNTTSFTNIGVKTSIFLNDIETYFNWQESVSFNNVALWKTALTNTQLAQLTTL